MRNLVMTFRSCSVILGLCCVLTARAEKADCGTNLQWEFDSSTGALVLTSPDATQRSTMSYSEVPWAAYREDIRSVELPDSLTNIAATAFSGCTALAEISLPDSLTTIGMQAFLGCTALATVDMGQVNSIGTYAFSGCTALEEITLPASVSTIAARAFNGCTSLSWIYCRPITPPNLDEDDVFAGCAVGFTICVANEALAAYQSNSNNWGHYYSEHIQTCSDTPTDLEKVQGDKVQGDKVQSTKYKVQSTKFIRNGTLYILKDESVYFLTGQIAE